MPSTPPVPLPPFPLLLLLLLAVERRLCGENRLRRTVPRAGGRARYDALHARHRSYHASASASFAVRGAVVAMLKQTSVSSPVMLLLTLDWA